MNEAAASEELKRPIVYGHNYCYMSRSLVKALNENNIDYEYRDIMGDHPEYKDELKKLARGYLSVPTVVCPDGTVMVEPPASAVLKKLRPPEQKEAGQPGLLARLLNH